MIRAYPLSFQTILCLLTNLPIETAMFKKALRKFFLCINNHKRQKSIDKLMASLPNLCCEYEKLLQNKVVDYGTGNSLIIDAGGSLTNCNVSFYGKNCVLHIGKNVALSDNDFWFEDDGGSIVIGDGTTTESGCKFASCEGKRIEIGRDCMFSHDVDVRNTDSHSILNEKGERINPSADIIIGEHVWVGIRSTILKGSVIPPNAIVAAQSLVTNSLKASEHTLIAGIPAEVIKTNISWTRDRL